MLLSAACLAALPGLRGQVFLLAEASSSVMAWIACWGKCRLGGRIRPPSYSIALRSRVCAQRRGRLGLLHRHGGRAALEVHVRVPVEGAGEGKVRQDEGEALEPVAAAVLQEQDDDDDGHKQHGGLEHVHVEVHGDVYRPAEHHAEGDDQDGDLRGRADSHAQRDVHLVLHREHDGGGVLRGIAHDGQQDGGHKGQRHAPAVGRSLDGVDQVVRQHGHQNGEEAQPKNAAPEAQHGLLLVVVVACILLLVKEVLVRVELEREVGAVDEEHDDADEAAQADVVVGAVQLGVRGVQQVGQHEA
mmetsp:Transcript_3035/g.7566  ORF Transcript_3035/g.7566 Transcript_3035/m.7566 type:complete len:301 (+) Transcript_3035:100-1002(+)